MSLEKITSQMDYDPNSLDVEMAKQYIFKVLDRVKETEIVEIKDSLNRILAENVKSPIDVPGFRNSAMDGYAFFKNSLKENREQPLEIAGTAFAGKPFQGDIKKNQALKIMTGSIVPDSLDTVVMKEHTSVENNKLIIKKIPSKGSNIRFAGEDIKINQDVICKGKKINPAEVGLLASLGISKIKVFRKLRVSFFSTGDELVQFGTKLKPGQLYDSNRFTIYGMLKKLDFEITDLGVIKDNPKEVENAFSLAAKTSDVIITSGGVSVGDADYIKQTLNKLGEVLFWKIAMKPGRPLAFGKIKNSYLFGLPGNPVAVMVTFYQFVKDALLYIQGFEEKKSLQTFKVKTKSKIKKNPGRTEFQRGILEKNNHGDWEVKTTGNQGSGILSSMSIGNCFIVLDKDAVDSSPGDYVNVQLFESVI